MGAPKALLRLGGRTFLECIASTCRAAGIERIVAVLNPALAEVPPGLEPAFNPDPESGMLASIQIGLRSVAVSEALIWPVDCPRVRSGTVRRLLATPGAVVVPTHGGRRGHPALFRVVPDLLGLAADTPGGARALVHRPALVEVDDPAVLDDFDTPEDLGAAGLEEPGPAVGPRVP